MRAIPELQLTGEPAMAVVGFMAAAPAQSARRLDMYQLNDALGARGWHLNALQRPPALHMCFTAAHASAEPLLQARPALHRRLRFTQRFAQHNALSVALGACGQRFSVLLYSPARAAPVLNSLQCCRRTLGEKCIRAVCLFRQPGWHALMPVLCITCHVDLRACTAEAVGRYRGGGRHPSRVWHG